MKRSLLAVSLLIGIVLSSCAAPRVLAQSKEDKVLLRLKLKAGQRYVMHVSTDNAVMQKLMGSATQNSTLTVETRVLAVAPNGTITTQAKITRIKIRMDMNGRTASMDTARPRAPGEPSTGTFRDLIGVPLTAQFTPEGKTLSLKGVDVMVRRLMAGVPKGKSAPAVAEMREIEASMRKMINPERLQIAGLNVYPKRAVGVGDTWRDKTSIGTSIVPSTNVTYRLMKRSGGIVTLLMSGNFRGAPKVDQSSGLSIREETTARHNLRIEIDENTGLTRLATGTVSTTTALTMSSSEMNHGAPQTATTNLQSRIRMTISDR